MEKIKNGWIINRKRFSGYARGVFMDAVAYRRPTVRLPPDAMRGSRFSSDESVLARVESECGEAEFMACPGPAIDAALLDAARSDHWYEYEKDYGTDETEIADEEIDE